MDIVRMTVRRPPPCRHDVAAPGDVRNNEERDDDQHPFEHQSETGAL